MQTKILGQRIKKLKGPRDNECDLHTVVHQNIWCEGCMSTPITGVRYKCAVCPDFDFCEKC